MGDLRAVGSVVERLRLVPDTVRRFVVPERQAREAFGIPVEALRLLPCRGTGRPAYDQRDLENIALELGLASPLTSQPRSWAAALEDPAPLRRLRVQRFAVCPDRGHAGPCRVRVLLPGEGWVRREVSGRGANLRLVSDLALRNEWPELPDAVHEAAAATDGLTLMSLPWGIGQDPELARRTGVVDCVGAALCLIEEGRRRGLEVRLSVGLLVTPPYSSFRAWAEFLVEGDWVPLDPVMVRALQRWGLLAEPVPADHPVGGMLARLAGTLTPIAWHNDFPVDLLYPTAASPA